MAQLAVTVVGPDRPGIVARATERLRAADGRVTDSTMTILGGRFAAVLLVAVPDTVDPAALEDDLATATADLGLAATVREVGEGSPSMPATHVVSVHGPDRSGIVHDVTAGLADHDINVTDLATRQLGGEQPVCVLKLEISASSDDTAESLAELVRARVPDLAVHVEPLEVAAF